MKKPIVQFDGEIKDKKLVIFNNDKYSQYLRSTFEEGDNVTVIIKKKRRNRSLNQNKYYWGVVIPILGDELGYSPDEMHEALKFKFLRNGGNDDLPKVTPSSSLNTKEFEDLMVQIRTWSATELHVNIPQPNEIDFLY